LGKKKLVKTSKGDYEALSVVITSGASHKFLGVKGEKEFANKGVYYCAVCDGPLFRGKNVMVVGGGDSATKESIFLASIANSVTVIHRRDKLRAEKVNQEHAFANKRIKFIWDSIIEEIIGKGKVEKVRIRNLKTNEVKEVPIDAVFIYIGLKLNTDFVDVKKTENGLIMTNEFMKTNVEGIYAAGYCRANSLRQLITSAGEGAIAAMAANEYIESLKSR
jgi:thioredoxin reductase (NADPH)